MTLNSSSINGTVLTVNWNAVMLNLSRNRTGKRQCFVPFLKKTLFVAVLSFTFLMGPLFIPNDYLALED